jgi:membrane-associated phospholipid phosphatase
MAEKVSKTRRIAKVISRLLHPYVVLTLVVAMIAYKVSPSGAVCAKWTMVALLPAYLFPFSYMQAKVAIVRRTTGSEMTFRSYFRERPNEMLVLACLFGIPSALILYFLSSPPEVIAIVVSVGVTTLVIGMVNRVYRASFHLAILTSLSIPLVLIFGLSLLVIAPVIVLLALSRYYLGEHTPPQLLAGLLIGLAVTEAIFYGFGLL